MKEFSLQKTNVSEPPPLPLQPNRAPVSYLPSLSAGEARRPNQTIHKVEGLPDPGLEIRF